MQEKLEKKLVFAKVFLKPNLPWKPTFKNEPHVKYAVACK